MTIFSINPEVSAMDLSKPTCGQCLLTVLLNVTGASALAEDNILGRYPTQAACMANVLDENDDWIPFMDLVKQKYGSASFGPGGDEDYSCMHGGPYWSRYAAVRTPDEQNVCMFDPEAGDWIARLGGWHSYAYDFRCQRSYPTDPRFRSAYGSSHYSLHEVYVFSYRWRHYDNPPLCPSRSYVAYEEVLVADVRWDGTRWVDTSRVEEWRRSSFDRAAYCAGTVSLDNHPLQLVSTHATSAILWDSKVNSNLDPAPQMRIDD